MKAIENLEENVDLTVLLQKESRLNMVQIAQYH